MTIFLLLMVAIMVAIVGSFIILGRGLAASAIILVSSIGYAVYRTKFVGDDIQSFAGWLLISINLGIPLSVILAKEFRNSSKS